MKGTVLWMTLSAALLLGAFSPSWAQSVSELEEDGVAHFKKAFYEALPRKRAAEAGDEFRMAENAFRKAIRQDPARVSAYRHLGRTYFVQGKYDEAADIYARALEIEPGNRPLYLQLASAREMDGDKEGAVAALVRLKAMEDDPRSVRMIDQLIAKIRATP